MKYNLVGFPFKSDVDAGLKAPHPLYIAMDRTRLEAAKELHKHVLERTYPRIFLHVISDAELDRIVETELSYLRGQ